MTAKGHDRKWFEEIFAAALALPAHERGEYIRQACGTDRLLEGRIWRLLKLDGGTGFLDSPLDAILPGKSGEEVIPTLVGRQIGKYRVLRVLGAGGMGTVYEVMQEQPRRRVALKVLNFGLNSHAARRRFEQEAEILGRLQHPAIAQIYEAGVFETDSGPQPFFAMELIEGQPLTVHVRHNNLGTRDRVRLLRMVCEGVEHAHSKGIVHRDLKPGNILIDGTQQPKILDFGIARATDSDAQLSTLRTDVGQLMGTLAYMSPEQMAGEPEKVSYQSDVYALGVICYELLGGRLPHDLRNRTVPQALLIIRDEDPPPLSSINRIFRGDLDTIVARALEKDTSRRYKTAAEFGDDLQRYLRDEPVLAHRPTTAYQLQKFARRNKALVAGTAAVFFALVLGIAGIGWQWVIARAERNRAVIAEAAAETQAAQVADAAANIMQVANESLADLPGGTRALEALAHSALTKLESLPPSTEPLEPSYVSTPYLLAYAYQRVGEVFQITGKTSDALAMHQKALALRQRLVQSAPAYETYVRTLAVGHWKVGEALICLGRLDAASGHYADGLQTLQQMSGQSQNDSPESTGVYIGGAHRRIGELKATVGDYAGAIGSFEKSLEFVDAGLSRAPAVLNLRRGKAAALRGYGEALFDAGQYSEALAALEKSMAIIQELRSESKLPRVWDMSNAVMTEMSLARALTATSGVEQGLSMARRAHQSADRLSKDDPDNFDSSHLLGRSNAVLGEMLHRSGASVEAALQLDCAIKRLEALALQDLDHVQVRRDLVEALIKLGAVRESLTHIESGVNGEVLDAKQCYLRANELIQALRKSNLPEKVFVEFERHIRNRLAQIGC